MAQDRGSARSEHSRPKVQGGIDDFRFTEALVIVTGLPWRTPVAIALLPIFAAFGRGGEVIGDEFHIAVVLFEDPAGDVIGEEQERKKPPIARPRRKIPNAGDIPEPLPGKLGHIEV